MGFLILLIIWVHYNNLQALQVFSIVILFLKWWFQKESSQMELLITVLLIFTLCDGCSTHCTRLNLNWVVAEIIRGMNSLECTVPHLVMLHCKLVQNYPIEFSICPQRWSSSRHQNISISSCTPTSWINRGEAPLLCIQDFVNHPEL